MFLPPAFENSMRDMLGSEYLQFADALAGKASVSIRMNDKTAAVFQDAAPVEWCAEGFYLSSRPLFTADPLFHAGAYYVQEASSMFLCQAVMQHFPNAETVLDLCAAPGGKSTLLTQYLPDSCLLVSNETVRQRAMVLAENITKWGKHNVFISNNEPRDFSKFEGFFDAVVVDAPCSGEGMFRKDSVAIGEWSLANVEMCAARQKQIVADVWNALKTNGILVYSTCTFNCRENEENVKWICENLGAECLSIDLQGNNKITKTAFGYRFYPHKTLGEGFFISVLRKISGNTAKHKIKINKNKSIKHLKSADFPFKLNAGKDWTVVNDNNFIKAYETAMLEKFLYLEQNLRTVQSSLQAAEKKGADFIPSAALALSKCFDTERIAKIEIDRQTAISFLKKENITLPDMAKGFVLLLFEGVSLGWVKNLGNRNNNLYPNYWKIRMNF
jgi:16S rRNA C967 or C1407 C5-methylase (RsmB/RsmF family)/NOL1/NOP2/fmu family ribosome biogenesis protein